MKTLLALSVVLILSSCASPIERRVTSNPQLFQKLSVSHQSAVRNGEVKEGMSKDAVFLAWGRPNRIQTGRRNGQALERWSYNSYEPVYSSSFGFVTTFGHGCHGGIYDPFYWGGPQIDYVPVEGRSVEFVNDKVVGFTMGR